MRLVNTLMTIEKITDESLEEIKSIITSVFPNRMEVFRFDYEVYKYHELDIDLFDVEFTKQTVYQDIDKVIAMCERILEIIQYPIDFIIANDDTATEVERYQKDCNDIKNFGLFVTKREIEGVNPYYQSQICNAYINLNYTSFLY